MSGLLRVDRIDGRLTPYDWAFPREEAARIAAHWAAQCRLKPGLFNGRVFLAHEWSMQGDTLAVRFFEAAFRDFLCWRDFGFPGAKIVNCFAMAALRSADGAYMLGEMAGGTANAGKLYFPSGTPEPKDLRPDGRVDLDSSVTRELEEETGLTTGDVVVDPGWIIVATPRPALACMKEVIAGETADALQARLAANNAAQRDPELARLVAVRGTGNIDPLRMPDFMIRYLEHALSRQAR